MKESSIHTPHHAMRWHQTVQVSGALNDNLFKLIALFALLSWHSDEARSTVLALVGAVFAIPFISFTTLGGYLVDRFRKTEIILFLKRAEFAIMGLGIAALATESTPLLFATLFLMSTQSALFGPCKYGLIPEIVETQRLARANSILQSLTYLAIIAGSALAPALTSLSSSTYHTAALGCLGVAAIGAYAARRLNQAVPTEPALAPESRSRGALAQSLRFIREDRWLRLSLIGLAGFSFIAAFTQMNVIDFGKSALGLSDQQSSLLLIVIGLGIGVGSLIAGRLSRQAIEFGTLPMGAFGISFSLLLLGTIGDYAVWTTVTFLFLLGFAAGLMTVPLHTFIQRRSPAASIGTILGLSGLFNWAAILGSSPALYFSDKTAHWAATDRFIFLGIAAIGLFYLAIRTVPDRMVRLLISTLARCFYRLDYSGSAHIPHDGPALLVSNHISLLDAVFVCSVQPRPVRLLMSSEYYDQAGRFTRYIARLARVIQIHESSNPKLLIRSLQTTKRALQDGELVCIFAEGHLARRGMLLPFKAGFTRIVKGTDAPIIPVSIDGLDGSITTYERGIPQIQPWRDGRPQVSVTFGAPLPNSTPVSEIRGVVQEQQAEASRRAKMPYRHMAEALVANARRAPQRPCISDTSGKDLTYIETLCAALLLADYFKSQLEADKRPIGIVLPASVGGALANLGLCLADRIPVNVNFKAGDAHIESVIEQTGLDTILTARAMPLPRSISESNARIIYIDDLLTAFTPTQKRLAYLKARFMPQARLLSGVQAGPDSTAAILFTSGSTRAPMGVCLTHRNIISNARAFAQTLSLQADERVLGCLPFFHSFGFSGSLWLPLINGIAASYHNNPLDSRQIGTLARESRATILLSTPTFLKTYCRRIEPAQFASLRWVFSSAERLPLPLAHDFEARFGLRPLEGYGATELSPIATLSLPSEIIDGLEETGNKPGSVGRPLPGVAIRIVSPETGELRPEGAEGHILVKGASVMHGYLGQAKATQEAIVDGWYHTGDVGYLDSDGFLFITDRLSRFAKLGGEMVSLGAVELALCECLGIAAEELAVIALPDPHKGERLIVLSSAPLSGYDNLPQSLREHGLPNLWIPDPGAFHTIDAIPLLASGKRDFGALKRHALKANRLAV